MLSILFCLYNDRCEKNALIVDIILTDPFSLKFKLGEYGGPIGALKAKDYEAVFVLAHPLRIPLHNIYEGLWFLKTGFPRYNSKNLYFYEAFDKILLLKTVC